MTDDPTPTAGVEAAARFIYGANHGGAPLHKASKPHIPSVGPCSECFRIARAVITAYLAALSAQPHRRPESCPHGDPTCPCPDGLACHYEGSDAWAAPDSEEGEA